MYVLFFAEQDQVEELSDVEVLNTGKPIWEARVDILGCADAVEYYGGIAATIAGLFSNSLLGFPVDSTVIRRF